jgi:apolipoprotein N-acyltransferase
VAPHTAKIFAILISIFIFGAIRLHQFESAINSSSAEQQITVGAVQPNIPIPIAAQRQPAPNAISNNFFTAIEQARTLARQHPEIDLLALPENPATFVFNQDSARRNTLGELITETGKPVVLNVDAIDAENSGSGEARRYNVTVLIDTNRNLAGHYPKMKRVPFVEYIPGETKFSWLRKWFPKSLRVLEGNDPKVFEIRPDVRVIPLICYEGTISSLTRRFINLGGNVIVNQVNDSWFLRTPASEFHLALTLFRAVEYRVPLVRVTNAGIGAHIQADGRIVPGSRTELFTETEKAFPLYVPPKRSVYSRIGNYWMLGFVLLLPVGKFFRRRAK